MPKLIALTPIKGAELHQPGDSFTCTDAEAKALIELGSARIETGEAETKPKGKGKK